MRYELSALVAAPGVLAGLCVRYREARLVALDAADLALVPVTHELLGELPATGHPASPETGFHRLSGGLETTVRECSRGGPVAYLEADYMGRDGRQTAAVWLRSGLLYGPEILGFHEPFPGPGDNTIDRALRVLGVEAKGHRDEFVMVGLGRHRRTEDWR